jgi:eukaryotic-like serine/threonine-protein kinase
VENLSWDDDIRQQNRFVILPRLQDDRLFSERSVRVSTILRAATMASTSDRNLLFGILALQMDFIPQHALIEGLQTWLLHKDKPLGEVLVERGFLAPENRSLLEPLVDAHIRQHGGDVQQSLAALSSDGGVAISLAQVEDGDLQASLSLLPQHLSARPESAFAREVGSPSTALPPDDPPATHDEAPVQAGGDDESKSLPSPAPVLSNAVASENKPGAVSDDPMGTTLPPQTLDEPERPQRRFHILRPHAEGGLGRVFVALDSELNREVAFKDIKPAHAQRKDAQTRFVVEAEVTGGLEHPGIVPVYGLGHFDDGRPFYAMRFIRGQSLLDAVRRFYAKASRDKSQPADAPASASAAQPTDKLPYASQREFRDLINRLIDVCNAMQYAHDRKVLHRDLKPGNIMLGKYGETLVVDWGLAKAVGKDNPLERSSDGELPIVPASGSQSAPTQMGSTLGTPAYMSPEQAEGKLDLLGPSCDIYSLGATLYEILTGQAPLKGLKIPDLLKRVINVDIPLPRTINPHAPLALQAVCQKAMARRPQDRYATAKLLADDLEAWLADEPVSAFREPLLARSRRWMRRHPALVSATAASILLTVLGLGGFSSVLAGKNEQLASANISLAQQRNEATVAKQLAEQNALTAREQTLLALSTLNSVVFDIQRSLAHLPRDTMVRQAILHTVLKQLENVAKQYANRSTIDRTAMTILMELGDTTLGISGEGLGPELQIERLWVEGVIPTTNSDPTLSYGQTIDGFKDAARSAQSFYENAHAIASRIVSDNPTNLDAQRDISVVSSRLGLVSLRLGNTSAASEYFRESERIAVNLGLKNSDARVQRDLSVAIEGQGDVSLQSGEIEQAIKKFQKVLAIRQRLAITNPADARMQRDLAIAYNRLGDISVRTHLISEALEFYAKGHEILLCLAANNRMNSQAQRDLMTSHYSIGELYRHDGRRCEATGQYLFGVALLEQMIEAGQNVDAATLELKILYEHIKLCEEPPT